MAFLRSPFHKSRLPAPVAAASFSVMSTIAEIESAISQLSVKEAEEVREWLEQWIEDQREMTPAFLPSIERGKADLAAGRTRVGSS